MGMFAAWKANWTLLDESTNTKDTCCLGSQHNPQLADQFPAGNVELEAPKGSFASAVAALRVNSDLVHWLAQTRGP